MHPLNTASLSAHALPACASSSFGSELRHPQSLPDSEGPSQLLFVLLSLCVPLRSAHLCCDGLPAKQQGLAQLVLTL